MRNGVGSNEVKEPTSTEFGGRKSNQATMILSLHLYPLLLPRPRRPAAAPFPVGL